MDYSSKITNMFDNLELFASRLVKKYNKHPEKKVINKVGKNG
jgi:hypothetical protein